MNFESYLEKKDPKHHEVLRLVHDQMLAAHPGIQLVKKWGLPVFMLKKNVAYLDVQKDRPLLGIMYMKDIPGMNQLTFVGNRNQIGHFYLDGMDDARFSELLTVIEMAVSHDLNR
ncbi:MAG: DUF1801 domain-containing protein [bacterium]|nr:DUF1801 domain-containing protein [bacterium]